VRNWELKQTLNEAGKLIPKKVSIYFDTFK
jgi:hypothetical protein